jgi:DNA-binding MarR family transcriptional regulator
LARAAQGFRSVPFFAIGIGPTLQPETVVHSMSKTANVRPKRAVRRTDANGNDDRAAAPIELGVLPDLVGYMLRRAQLAVFQDFWRAFEAYDVRPAQYAVLLIIERNPGLRQSQVSAALNIKRANLVALLDSLEKRGLAKRVPVATDRRSYALHLTEDGVALLKKLSELSAAHEQRVSATIGESGRKELLRLLHGVVQAVGPSAPDDEDES